VAGLREESQEGHHRSKSRVADVPNDCQQNYSTEPTNYR